MPEPLSDPRRSRWRAYDWITGADGRQRTPLGHPIVSRYDVLSERIEADLRAYGNEPHSPSSAYRLQALYLDFGSPATAQELTEPVLRAFEVPHERTAATSDPRLLEAARDSLADLGEEELTGLGERLARLSRRALMTALVFDAHFWNIRLALAVVRGERPLGRAATGTCAFVAETRIGRGLGGDPHYYAPLRERQPAFCYSRCLPVIGPGHSADPACLTEFTPTTCGMLRVLEAFRFFASFPDEP